MRQTKKHNKIKQKTIPMPFQDWKMFGVISNIQNWHAKYNFAQIYSDLSFLDGNTSFTLACNSIALIISWKFLKLNKIQEKRQIFIFCFMTSNSEMYCFCLMYYNIYYYITSFCYYLNLKQILECHLNLKQILECHLKRTVKLSDRYNSLKKERKLAHTIW